MPNAKPQCCDLLTIKLSTCCLFKQTYHSCSMCPSFLKVDLLFLFRLFISIFFPLKFF